MGIIRSLDVSGIDRLVTGVLAGAEAPWNDKRIHARKLPLLRRSFPTILRTVNECRCDCEICEDNDWWSFFGIRCFPPNCAGDRRWVTEQFERERIAVNEAFGEQRKQAELFLSEF